MQELKSKNEATEKEKKDIKEQLAQLKAALEDANKEKEDLESQLKKS
jgi:predicted  nucleic acid-binding Zn-ribbon protein